MVMKISAISIRMIRIMTICTRLSVVRSLEEVGAWSWAAAIMCCFIMSQSQMLDEKKLRNRIMMHMEVLCPKRFCLSVLNVYQ